MIDFILSMTGEKNVMLRPPGAKFGTLPIGRGMTLITLLIGERQWTSRQEKQMAALLQIQLQDIGKTGKDLIGDVNIPTLFEPRVPGNAYAYQLSEFFSSETRLSTPGIDWKIKLLWSQTGTAGFQKIGELRTTLHYFSHLFFLALLWSFGIWNCYSHAYIAVARQSGPYDLIIDVLGGNALATALSSLLKPDGLCVSLGIMDGFEVTLKLREIFGSTGNVNLSTLVLPVELKSKAGTEGLTRLASLVAEGRLHPLIGVEAPWTEIATIVQQFQTRRFPGKAVLHIS